MPVNLYYTQQVRGFQQESVKYSLRQVEITLRRTVLQCPKCGATKVTKELLGIRDVRGVPQGNCREVHLRYPVHRLYCHHCHRREMEHIPFLSHSKATLTKSLERTVIELRRDISIRAVANYFHLRWHTVKELEKRYLKHRFAKIPTAHIKAIGIDEIHVGNGKADSQYLTIVRDLDSGAVLHVGNGKGINAPLPEWRGS